MNCKKCKKEIPDGSVYCNWCGAKQERAVANRHRSRGEGTAYKRGSTWTGKRSAVVNGKLTSQTKGGFKTKADAYAWAVSGEEAKPRNGLTTKQVYDLFIARHEERVGKSTIGTYKAGFNYFKPIHNKMFADLRTSDWQACIDSIDLDRTRRAMKTLAGLLYKYAIEENIVQMNYAQFIWFRKSKEPKETVPLSRDELKKIYDAAIAGDDEAALIAIDCYTGFRPTELIDMKKESVYDGCFHGGIKTDAGKKRVVPIAPKIAGLVERFYARDGEYMFRMDGIENQRQWRLKSFYKTLARCGINNDNLTPYSCRHTFATLLKDVEGVAFDKSKLMGHTTTAMTEHYQHADVESLRNIMSKL